MEHTYIQNRVAHQVAEIFHSTLTDTQQNQDINFASTERCFDARKRKCGNKWQYFEITNPNRAYKCGSPNKSPFNSHLFIHYTIYLIKIQYRYNFPCSTDKMKSIKKFRLATKTAILVRYQNHVITVGVVRKKPNVPDVHHERL